MLITDKSTSPEVKVSGPLLLGVDPHTGQNYSGYTIIRSVSLSDDDHRTALIILGRLGAHPGTAFALLSAKTTNARTGAVTFNLRLTSKVELQVSKKG